MPRYTIRIVIEESPTGAESKDDLEREALLDGAVFRSPAIGQFNTQAEACYFAGRGAATIMRDIKLEKEFKNL